MCAWSSWGRDAHITVPRAQRAASIRAWVAASLLLLANSWWLRLREMIWHSAYLTITAVPINVARALLGLTRISTVVRHAA